MKLKNINGNEILKSCRYCDGRKGSFLLEEFKSCNFETFDQWESMSQIWGYTELPDNLTKLSMFCAERRCRKILALQVLELLHYPNLQCAMMTCITDLKYFKQLLVLWITGGKKSKSVLWSIFEIWQWRLRMVAENRNTSKSWIHNSAVDIINDFMAIVFHYDCSKEFSRWLFSKGYRGWLDNSGGISNEKQLFLLMEGNLLLNWKNETLDTYNVEMDYLSFVATDVDEKYILDVNSAKVILKNYDKCIDEKSLTCIELPPKKNTLNWLSGYANMFWKNNAQSVIKSVKQALNQRMCFFEGWKAKGNIPDYRNIQQENFILCSFMLMIKVFVKELRQKEILFDLVSEHLYRQVHTCNKIFQKYYSLALCISRDVASYLSKEKLDLFDQRLILEHCDLEEVLSIFNYSHKIIISEQNKKSLLYRWNFEKDAWRGRKQTTNQKPYYDLMEKRIKII